jgi:hypothetical protein
MIRTNKFIEYFPQTLDALYPDTKPSLDLAVRLIAHHFTFLNKVERDFYLRHFIDQHANRYGIFDLKSDEKESVVSMVLHSLPEDTDQINPKAVDYLSNFSEDQLNNSLKIRRRQEYMKEHISFAEILNNPAYKIKSPYLFKTYIKKLGIEVKTLNDGLYRGRFITSSDLEKILSLLK